MNELNVQEWLENRTVYLCIAGSHAYGMNTEESDHDIRGACIAPQRYYYGLEQFEQSDKKGNLNYYNTILKQENYVKPELVVWDLRKFVHLASKGNPNMIELLFLDPKFYIYVHPIFQKILDNREWFLSKKLRYRFGGYANNQLKRMRNHYRWLHSPPTHQPTRNEFGIQLGKYKLPEDQLQAARTIIQRLVDSWLVDETELDPDLRIQLGYDMKQLIEIVCTELKIKHEEIHIKDELYFAAVKQLGFQSNFMEYLHREKAYHIALDNWNHYQKWLKDRNPKRAALEAKFGFDCYLDDTEFLTEKGWKFYDEVSQADKLATFNQDTEQIEFQQCNNRFETTYSGELLDVKSMHSNFTITLNHKMLVSDCHRSLKNNLSTEYTKEKANWRLEEALSLIHNHRTFYHIRVSGQNKADYPISDTLLLFIGLYLSEGSFHFRNNNKSTSLRISQHPYSNVIPILDDLQKLIPNMRKYYYEYRRKNGTLRKEVIYTVVDPLFTNYIVKECGYKEKKRLPSFVVNLSTRQARLLLIAMLLGDGTKIKSGGIYYTKSKQLADDIQKMGVCCGIKTTIRGPYYYKRPANYEFGSCPMYQVHILDGNEISYINKIKHFHIKNYNNVRVVCFDVPNSILVTRRKGKIAIQGNSKHGSHLYRLLDTCIDFFETGQMNVTRPNADYLKAIREEGVLTYEEIIEWAEQAQKKLDELVAASTLRKDPKKAEISELLTACIDEYMYFFPNGNIL